MLLAAGPLVASWRRVDVAGEAALAAHDRDAAIDAAMRPRLALRLPQVVSLGLTLAALGFLSAAATPATQHWAERDPGDRRLARPDDIWTMAPDGSRQTRLTTARSGAESYHEPIWAPDGSAILVIAGRALEDESQGIDGVAYDLAVLGADGSRVRAITDSPEFDAQAHLSPDGTNLAFSSQRLTTAALPTPAASDAQPSSATASAVTGGGPQPGRDPGLGVQADGTSVAPGFRWDIYVANADGSKERRLTEGGTINIATGWGDDGRILFHSDRDGDFDVYTMRPDGGDVRPLTDDPADDTWPALAADGRIAFTSDRDGDFDIWTAAADGSDPHPLTDDPADDWMPAWSPDGSTIAFLSGRDETTEVYAVPAAGGEARNLSRTPAMDELITAGAWSPDGSTIVYSSSPIGSAATDPEIRTLLALAVLLVWSATLAGLIVAAVRRAALPRGAITIALLVAAIPAGLAFDEPRVIVAAVVAGIVGDLIVWVARPGPARPRAAWLLGTVLPATWTAAYLAAVDMTTGSSLSIHAASGAIALSGVVGLLMALVIVRDRPPIPAQRDQAP
jgi:Tol biopolymer transport system component